MTLILSLTLAPPRIAANGRSGASRSLDSVAISRSISRPAYAGRSFGDADRRGVGPMGGPEGVVDVDVGVGGERRRRRPGRSPPPRRGTGGSRGAATSPGRSRLTASSVPSPSASPVTGTLRRSSSVRRWPTGRSRRLSVTLPSGRPRWLARTTRAPAWSRAAIVGIAARIARVVGDLAVRERDVEVDADEDALAGDVRVADGELVHRSAAQAATGRRAATKATRSATRQL